MSQDWADLESQDSRAWKDLREQLVQCAPFCCGGGGRFLELQKGLAVSYPPGWGRACVGAMPSPLSPPAPFRTQCLTLVWQLL